VEKLKTWVQLIGAIFSILAFLLSAVAFIRVDRLEELFDKIGPLEVQLSLSEPEDGTEVEHYVIEIAGQITVAAHEPVSSLDVNLTLAERDIDIVPLVRPLSEANLWWAQTKPVIDRKGYFQGSVNVGDKDGRGVGEDFQIVVIAVPRGAISQGDTFRDLPTFGAASRIVTVKRSA